MLGPELIGIPTRIAFSGVEQRSLSMDYPVARELGLARGQIVEALVALRAGQMFLEMGGKQLLLQGPPPFPPGVLRQFRVQFGPTQVMLIPTGSAPAAATTARAAVAGTPGTLPPVPGGTQSPPPAVSSTGPLPPPAFLRLLTAPPLPAGAQLTAIQNILALASQVPALQGLQSAIAAKQLSWRTLKAADLRESLQSSGLFLESSLRQSRPVGPLDWKRLLQTTLRQLELHSHAAARQAVAAALEQVERAQVDAIQAQHHRESLLSWLLFLREGSPVELSLEHLPDPDTQEGYAWFVNLYSETERWGPLWMRSRLQTHGELDVILWAPHPDTAAKARVAEADLRFELREAGLQLEKFRVLDYPRPDPPAQDFDPGTTFTASV